MHPDDASSSKIEADQSEKRVVVMTGATSGFGRTFAVDHLAHYLLARLMLPRIDDGGRLVITSSSMYNPPFKRLVPKGMDIAEWAHPKRTFAATLVLACALSAPGAMADEAVAAVTETRLPAVTVAVAEPRTFVQRVAISGTLLPREEVLVYPSISGQAIVELAAEAGDQVRAGDVLVRLDDRTLRAQLIQAEAGLAQAEASRDQARSQVISAEASLTQATRTLARTRTLRERGAATEAVLQDVEAAARTAEAGLQSAQDAVAAGAAQVAQAEAGRDLARTNLDAARITAPVDGVISERGGLVGAIASAAGEPLFRIIRDGEIEAEVSVLETDLGRIEPGDPVDLRIAGLAPLSGIVRRISPTVDPQSRLGAARIAIDETPGLRPGLFAAGWITSAEREGLGVPATAVILDGSGGHVLLAGEGGVLERREVSAQLMWDGWIEITGDIGRGDTVVARAGAFFTDGDVIRPILAGEDPFGDETVAAGEHTQ